VLAACRALAQGLHAALSGKGKPVILATLSGARDSAGALLQAAPPTASAVRSASAAFAAATDVFARSQNFREAALAAANLGGDSDVVGAVCGALAGAHYGASAIPAAWRNGLLRRGLIEGCADRLLAHALLDLGG
jgi:ADP-ribosyl-[dinitrogen reductase] hydrolase